MTTRSPKAVETHGRTHSSPAFGALLRRYRLAAGLSQQALAERARISTEGIGALERGIRRTPQRETLALLAEALVLSADQRRAFESAAARPRLLRPGDGRASITAGPWPDAAASNLSLSLTSFVGREAELGEIVALVRAHRLVTLTGAGGIGKTRTALQVGTVLGNDADRGVWLVELAPIGNPALVTAAIAATLGVQEVPNRRLLETLLASLKNKRLVLILDNCEHVIADAALVADSLLRGCSGVQILATSREPLRVAGERAYRLPSLSAPSLEAAHRLGTADATTYAAIALFTERAQAADYRFAPTDENVPVLAEICRRLDGIPLAIELAAARVTMFPLEVLSKKLDQRFRILTGGDRAALPRQQTMRATIDWSYGLLTTQEQRLFEQLSVFAGGCTLAAATVVYGSEDGENVDVLDLMSSLVDKSMAVADLEGNEPRYRLLESFREFAREKLATRGEEMVVAHRHVLACLELAERLDPAYDAEPDRVWRELAQDELDNWRAALEWALFDRGDVALGQQLVGALNVVWINVSPLEGRRWVTAALRLADEQTPTKVLASLAYAEATIAWRFREYNVQFTSSEVAIARYQQLGDELGTARAQTRAAHALASLGRVVEAKSRLQEALVSARGLDNRQLAAYVLRCLGYASSIAGDVVVARGYVGEALQIYEALGATLTAALTVFDLSEHEFRAGNADLGVQLAKDALVRLRAFSAIHRVPVLSNLSGYLISLHRYDEAEAYAREALDLAREQRRDVFAAWALAHLVAIVALRPQAVAGLTPTTYAHVARILGCIDARLAAMGSGWHHTDQQEYDRVLAALRDAIGTDEVATLMAAGAAMTEDQAIEGVPFLKGSHTA